MVKIVSTPSYNTDVLVVGAGPAGASLGIHLRRSGYSVTLIDSEKFPRDKVCGDFVGPLALKELERLGIADQFKNSNVIDRSAVFLEGKQLIEQEFPSAPDMPGTGKVIPRIELDEKLFKEAKRSGVQTLEQCRLQHYTVYPTHVEAACILNKTTYNIITKLIVGADGSNSTVARILNGKNHPPESKILAVRAYFNKISGPANRADLYFKETSFPGYCWLFPTGENTANVGVGMVMETIPKSDKKLKEMLEELILSDEAIHKRMQRAEIAGKIAAWPLSTFDPNMKYVADRVLLIGDAGGLVNSLNGEGIQYALLSGRWASETIDTAIQANDFGKQVLSHFQDLIVDKIGYDLALSRIIIQFIRNRNLNPFWIQLFKVIVERSLIDKSYAEIAGGMLAGVVPANKVIHPAFLTKTILQSGVHFGMQGIHTLMGGPKAWKELTSNTVKFSLDFTKDISNNPQDYLKWTNNLGKDLTRLGKYTLHDLITKSGTSKNSNYEN